MYDTIPGLLKDKQLPAAALLAIALTEFGFECLDWEPEILRLEMTEEFGIPITDTQSDKLQAAITILSTDHFESDWHTFNTVIHCLNAEPTHYDTFDPVDAEQIASAMPEVDLIRNNFVDGGIKFSAEVNTYAGLIFSEYGLIFTPQVFPTAMMPNLSGDRNIDSQTEKQEALQEVYSAKKKQILEYLNKLQSCYTT